MKLKNSKFYIFFFLIYGLANVNSQNYLNNFKSEICECLQQKELTYKNIEHEYNNCFKSKLVNYATIIDLNIQEDDKTKKYIEGQKIRRNLKMQFQHELMFTCNTYFYTIERALFKFKEKAKLLGDSTQLQRHHELVAMQPNWNSYFSRAKEYYKLNDLKRAENDVIKSIEVSPFDINDKRRMRAEKLFLAQVYEDQKKYSEALNVYNDIDLGDIDKDVKILKAIVVRKRDGNYEFPFLNEDQDVNSQISDNEKSTPNINSKTDTKSIVSENNSNRRRPTSSTRTDKPLKSIVREQKDSIKTNQVKKNQTKQRDTTKKNLRALFKLD